MLVSATLKSHLGAEMSRDVALLEPQMKRFALALVEQYNAERPDGTELRVICTLRTKEQQARLYAQGRTLPGAIVTYTLHSRHLPNESGLSEAVDFGIFQGGVYWTGGPAEQRRAYEAMVERGLKLAEWLDIPVRSLRPKEYAHFELVRP